MAEMKKLKSSPKQSDKAVGKSTKSRIYAYLRQQISSGTLPGGHVVSEIQLSRTLGTSRSPIREAIAQLVADGLLEQAPNRSAIVIDLSRQDIIDLFEVREALEIYAVRKVAQRGLHPINLEQLKKSLDSIQVMIAKMKAAGQRALNEDQMSEFTRLDHRLHALLVISTQNIRMQKIVGDTRVLVRIFAMRHRGHELSMLERIQRQHTSIVQAVAKGNANEAARLLSEHIQASLRERLDEFDLWKREQVMLAHSHEGSQLELQGSQI
jgi:DNA-binding GntR family transcriptional regulator